jgi:hypothetical protein
LGLRLFLPFAFGDCFSIGQWSSRHASFLLFLDWCFLYIKVLVSYLRGLAQDGERTNVGWVFENKKFKKNLSLILLF